MILATLGERNAEKLTPKTHSMRKLCKKAIAHLDAVIHRLRITCRIVKFLICLYHIEQIDSTRRQTSSIQSSSLWRAGSYVE
jgi:hypothetical protein